MYLLAFYFRSFRLALVHTGRFWGISGADNGEHP
jgi:hypothetical protein